MILCLAIAGTALFLIGYLHTVVSTTGRQLLISMSVATAGLTLLMYGVALRYGDKLAMSPFLAISGAILGLAAFIQHKGHQ